MKTSIATVSLSGTFREKLAAIKAAGFDGIEIFEQDFLSSDESPRTVSRMVRDHGLEITLFQPFRDFEALPDPYRARAFARARRKFDLMAELGTDLVLVCSNTHPAALGGIDRAAEDFRALGEIAAPYGIRVGYEALAWGRHVNDHRDAWEIVRRADHPQIGLILDSFHTLARRIDPDTIRAIPGDRIFFVQLADAPAIPMDLLYWSRHFRNMPLEGDLDVTGFMRAVMAAGYRGPWSLEIFNDQFRAGLPRLVAQDGHRSLIALADSVARAEPALAPALPRLAPPQQVEDVAFLEFATSAEEEAPIAALLSCMGFEKTGHHHDKAVSLWRQGDIVILLNAETQGFARTVWAVHGSGIAEIGLWVADAAGAEARGLALGASVHRGAPGPQDLDIPGLRGAGGSALRFLERERNLGRVWTHEFAEEPRRTPDAGLTRVDHLAHTMPYDEMLSWSLFYATLFDATKSPVIDVVDPAGLVRSQSLVAGGLRMTLNGAEARDTLAGRFINDTFGAAIQHVAFATADIFATARTLKERGFPALEISPNYYADIAARFGLDPETVATLADLHLLYDEDESGRFYQLYSQSLHGGFFFEITQRIGNYQGYGGSNAPFRLAAQRRSLRPAAVPKA